MTPILEIRGLAASYGKISAISNIDITVADGGIVTVVGPNGAGKTTLLNAVSGLFPSSGEVYLNGERISHLSTEKRIARGLCLVSERRELFATMTVEDNLLLGAYSQYRKRAPYKDTFSDIYDMFPRLHERRKQQAGTLSGGERQMLAIGRALMSKPKMLLLDEPSLGLSPKVTKDMLAAVAQLRTTGVSILLVEQNVRSALRISDHAYVLETGAITMSGPAQQVAADSRVIDSYLGVVNTPN
jgi:branched-chain amino acid transport system ATP-binding protein